MKSLKISNNELMSMKDKIDLMDLYNKKMQLSRKRQLVDALKDSTEIRVQIMKKVKNWIDLLEDRIFNATTIGEMDLDKVLELFKTTTQYSLALLAQINDMEGLFKAYTDTTAKIDNIQTQTQGKADDEVKEIKLGIMKAFMEQMKKTAEDAVPKVPEAITQEETDEELSSTFPVEGLSTHLDTTEDSITVELPELPGEIGLPELTIPENITPEKTEIKDEKPTNSTN